MKCKKCGKTLLMRDEADDICNRCIEESTSETLPEKLARLVRENPGIPVLPMVAYEVCISDDYRYWGGAIEDVEIKTVYEYGELIRFSEDSEEDIKESIFFDSDDEYDLMPDDLVDAEINRFYESIPHHKAIVITIGTP